MVSASDVRAVVVHGVDTVGDEPGRIGRTDERDHPARFETDAVGGSVHDHVSSANRGLHRAGCDDRWRPTGKQRKQARNDDESEREVPKESGGS